MNNAQWRYYAINQWLLGKSLDELPVDAQQAVEDCGVQTLWKKSLEFPRVRLNEIESVMLRFLRTDFGFCVSTEGRILLLSQIYDFIRAGELRPEDGVNWAVSTFSVAPVDDTAPYISDCVLYAPREYFARDFDFENALSRAFTLRAVGYLNCSDSQLEVLCKLEKMVSPKEELSLTKTAVKELFKAAVDAEVNPQQLSNTALLVPDLSVTYECTRALCWWADSEGLIANVLLPRTTKDSLVLAQFPVSEFVQVCGDDLHGLEPFYVKGDTIMKE